jgi:hypothetical protein
MLLAANQDSGCITCFRRDEKTGRLEPEKAGISCPVPVCIKLSGGNCAMLPKAQFKCKTYKMPKDFIYLT